MSSDTAYMPLTRTKSFYNEKGELSYVKHTDDELQITIDWTGYLNGDTVSSASYSDSGVTTSGKSVTSSTTVCTVTGVGYTDIEVTTAASRTVTRRVNFYELEGSGSESDYD